ncbi:RNase H domain-containing protein [Trichonephila clavipes]|nr:RNase H domain-containing protein [Trichonephila clavipes]
MLNFEVDKDLHNRDHFPLLFSHINGAETHLRHPTYHFHHAEWDKLTRLAVITGTMVQNRAVDEAVLNVTECIRNAADAEIPKTSNSIRKLCRPWCRQPLPHNCDFDIWELMNALSSAQNTSPSPDGISHELLHHFNEDSLQITCEGSVMAIIEQQLQTAVNNLVKWCDTNGHSISASKSSCVHICCKPGLQPDP